LQKIGRAFRQAAKRLVGVIILSPPRKGLCGQSIHPIIKLFIFILSKPFLVSHITHKYDLSLPYAKG
jgi:hypothetical protein